MQSEVVQRYLGFFADEAEGEEDQEDFT